MIKIAIALKVETSFRQFLDTKPSLKALFFGGKGGVGKTVVAAAAAYYIAERLGRKTLISSTNPVHSLSGLFGQDIWGKGVQKLEGTNNLYAAELDIGKTVDRYKKDIREKMLTLLKYADVPVDMDPFVDIATTNPAFEESAMFDDVVNLLLNEDFSLFVFDTAPVAHTYRLLGMSSIYDVWLHKLIKSREETFSLKVKLSFRKEKVLQELKRDPVLASLIETRKRTAEARKILTDQEKTAFFFVTLPLALPIAVIDRFISWVRAFNIPVGGVIVNGVLPREDFELSNTSSYIVNKLAEEESYIKTIYEKFPGLVRAFIPTFETDVSDLATVSRMAEALAQ